MFSQMEFCLKNDNCDNNNNNNNIPSTKVDRSAGSHCIADFIRSGGRGRRDEQRQPQKIQEKRPHSLAVEVLVMIWYPQKKALVFSHCLDGLWIEHEARLQLFHKLKHFHYEVCDVEQWTQLSLVVALTVSECSFSSLKCLPVIAPCIHIYMSTWELFHPRLFAHSLSPPCRCTDLHEESVTAATVAGNRYSNGSCCFSERSSERSCTPMLSTPFQFEERFFCKLLNISENIVTKYAFILSSSIHSKLLGLF